MKIPQTSFRRSGGSSGKIEKLLDNLFSLFVGSLYTYALCSSMLLSTYLQPGTKLLLWVSVGSVFFFHLWFYNRYTFLSGLSLLVIGLSVTLIILYKAEFQSEWFLSLRDFVLQLIRHIEGRIPYQPQFNIIGLLMAFGIGLIATLNLQIRYHFVLLSLLGSAAFALPYLTGYQISQLGLVLFFLCFLLMLVYQQGRGKTESQRRPLFAVTILPLCVAATIVASLLPRPAINYSSPDRLLSAISQGAVGVEEYLYTMFNPKYFSFQTIGFAQNSGKLGGAVSGDSRYVMRVTTDVPVYLRGAIKDTYTGESWYKSKEETTDLYFDSRHRYQIAANREMYRMVNLINLQYNSSPETFYQAIGYEPTEEEQEFPIPLSDILVRPFHHALSMISDQNGHHRVVVQLGTSRTQDIFVPNFAQTLSIDDDVSLRQDSYGSIYADRLLLRQAVYSFTTIDWNHTASYDMAAYQDYIHGFAKYMEAEGVDVVGLQYMALDGADVVSLSGVPDYLALPDTLPVRVGELAAEVVGEETNPYRMLKLLERYLHQFPYTLSPEDVPNGVDFVDYFLFEGQEGYCTYFASAFAVMARTLGIPTRYLEGYALPAQKNADGSYTITNREAHAWVEAWLPGIGWYPFEPTPPFSQSFYTANELETEEVGLSADISIPQNPGNAPQATSDEQPEDIRTSANQGRDNTSATADTEEEAGTELLPTSSQLIYIIAAVVFVLFLLITLRLVWYRVRKNRLERLDNKSAVLHYFKLLRQGGNYLGCPMQGGESAIGWFRRTQETLGFRHPKAVGEVYSRAAYSTMEITSNERTQLQLCYADLLGYAKEKCGRVTHWINHYLWQRY